MKSAFLRFHKAYSQLLVWAAVVGGGATFAIMWLVDASALSRKLFNAPIVGSVEITQSLMVLSIMLPMGYAQLKRSHLRVTLLTRKLPEAWARRLYVFSLLCGAVFFALVCWATFGFALRSFNINEYIWGAQLRFPVYPAKGVLCLGSALISLQFLLDAVKVGILGMTEESDELAAAQDSEVGSDG